MGTLSKIITGILITPLRAATKLRLLDDHRCMELVSHSRGRLGSAIRKGLLRRMGARIGNGAYIAGDCEFWFEDPRLLSIGSGTWVDKNCRFGEMMPGRYEIAIGNNVRLFDGLRFGAYAGPIKIGDRSRIGFFSVFRGPAFLGKASLISHHVVIVGGGHQFDKMDSLFVDQGVEVGPVNIGDSVWIGSNATIVPGVTIGEHAIIGANSVVTKDIPSYCIAAGCPARVIKRYDFEKKEWVRASDKRRET